MEVWLGTILRREPGLAFPARLVRSFVLFSISNSLFDRAGILQRLMALFLGNLRCITRQTSRQVDAFAVLTRVSANFPWSRGQLASTGPVNTANPLIFHLLL
jgi:hypothetical protein